MDGPQLYYQKPYFILIGKDWLCLAKYNLAIIMLSGIFQNILCSHDKTCTQKHWYINEKHVLLLTIKFVTFNVRRWDRAPILPHPLKCGGTFTEIYCCF